MQAHDAGEWKDYAVLPSEKIVGLYFEMSTSEYPQTVGFVLGVKA